MKKTKAILLTVIVAVLLLGSLVYCLEVVPEKFIQESSVGWLAVRGIALVLSLVAGLLTYGVIGQLGKAFREVVQDVRSMRDDIAKANSFDSFLNRVKLTAWLMWAVIIFQIFASFYVSEWCKNGF